MADLSVAVLVGRLTRDAELKYTNSGQAVCHFAVATGTRRKKGDQWVDESSFWDVDLWGKQGESINQYLTKGKLVAVEGTMRQDRWEQDGQSRMKVIVNANTVQLLGATQSGGQSYGGSQGAQDGPRDSRSRDDSRSQSSGQAPQAPSSDEFSDDIPF
ncbi:MAG: single-stranded DNA-binding protein [Spirochaetales bacterium]|nr:single-stranded DNA-binding protein [Spirochaetales bacterium]